MRPALAVASVVLSVALGACGFMPSAAPSLEEVGWRAVAVAGRPPVAGSEPTLRFANGTLRGTGGCNQIGGGFRLVEGRLEITELSGTAMGCPAPRGEIEGAFMKVLLNAETIRFDGPNLVIAGPGGEIVLRPDPAVR